MATQQELKKRLKVLMNRAENQVCSDCPEKQPRWASLIVPPPGSPPGSLPIGAFCCLECSGSHRRLGVHISFVRSVNLDQWKEREVQAMENGGNKKVNAIFEAKLGPYSDTKKPQTGASGPERERFIRDKYERRKFYDSSVMLRFYENDSEESESEEEEEEEAVTPARGGSRRTVARQTAAKVVVRAPSDAARRRAEARLARQGAGASSGTTASGGVTAPKRTAEVTPKAAPVPASAPVPEVDLLDFNAVPATPDQLLVPPPPSPAASPQLDLFANMSVSNGGILNASDAAASAVQQKMLSDQRKMKNDEILAMFHSPQQKPQSQQAFGDFSALSGMSSVYNPGMQGMNSGGGAMMNNPSGGFNMMGGYPHQMAQSGGRVGVQQDVQGRNMMIQNNKGNSSMLMQQRTDSGMISAMMMQQQQQQQMCGMGMGQQGVSMGGGGMGEMGMSMGMGGSMGMGMMMGMNPQQQQQFSMVPNQMPMGGMSSSGGSQLMGGQPMGGHSTPGQMYGGQPMGGHPTGAPVSAQTMGGNQRKPQMDQFSEFSPW